MNTIIEFIPEALVSALGWTLVHNLWQSAVILILLYLFQKIFNPTSINTRYILKVISLFAIVVWSVYTFAGQLIFTTSYTANTLANSVVALTLTSFNEPISTPYLLAITIFLEDHFNYIIGVWLIGMTILFIKTAGGVWYINRLKEKSSTVVNEAVLISLERLLRKLKITKRILVKESVKINVPMVIGHIKPVVLIPLGFCTGLPAQQIEAILAHELSHIKRHDYLVNIIQSIVEIIFFYNPFLWILSSQIRKEREISCDDLALRIGINKITFANALATIEQLKINNTTMAMTHGKNKNDLLNRIKRVVEGDEIKSSKFTDKAFPLLVIIGALISFSWYSVKPIKESKLPLIEIATPEPVINTVPVLTDTTIVEEPVAKSKSSASITWEDDEGNTKHRYIEAETAEEISKALESLDIPEIANIDVDLDETFDALKDMDLFMDNSFEFDFDTIPFDSEKMQFEMQKMSEEFAKMQKHMELQFKELQELENLQNNLNENQLQELHEAMRKLEESESLAKLHELEKLHEEQFRIKEQREQELQQRSEEFSFQEQEKRLKEMEEHIKHEEEKIKVIEEQMQQFEKALEKQLREDGYLKKGEKLKTFEYRDRGLMKVNGKTVKNEDAEKYKKLREKYMDN